MSAPEHNTVRNARDSKRAVREHVWRRLEESGAALSPGAWGRIPNFKGADTAADRLAGQREWQSAHVVKANPDRAQMPVRAHALRDGKIVYMAVPRLAGDHPFVMLNPEQLPRPGYCPHRKQIRPDAGDTKSRAGRRTIGLPDPLVALFKAHKRSQDAERQTAQQLWHDEGWVFARPDGRPLSTNSDYHE